MSDVLPVQIRPLDSLELDAIERHIPAHPPSRHHDRLKLQFSGEAVYLIAWCETHPVGHVLIHLIGSSEAIVRNHLGICPHLEDLFVTPSYRSRGIGTQLVTTAEFFVRTRDFTHLGLSIAAKNIYAREFYTRLGYRDCGLGEYISSGWYLNTAQERVHWSDTSYYLVKEL